ncbi:hypothetical protein [Megalodesulfovibrio paquesii]
MVFLREFVRGFPVLCLVLLAWPLGSVAQNNASDASVDATAGGVAAEQPNASATSPLAVQSAGDAPVAAPASEALPATGGEASQPDTSGPQRIEGAFGYLLGERWTGRATPAEPGLLKVEVPPLVDSGVFDFHSLWLDPETRAIVQISASRAFETPREAEEAHLALINLLTAKYGPPRTEQTRQVFEVQDRSAHVLLSLEGGMAILGVVYQDNQAAATALTRPRFELNLPDIPGYNETSGGVRQ